MATVRRRRPSPSACVWGSRSARSLRLFPEARFATRALGVPQSADASQRGCYHDGLSTPKQAGLATSPPLSQARGGPTAQEGGGARSQRRGALGRRSARIPRGQGKERLRLPGQHLDGRGTWAGHRFGECSGHGRGSGPGLLARPRGPPPRFTHPPARSPPAPRPGCLSGLAKDNGPASPHRRRRAFPGLPPARPAGSSQHDGDDVAWLEVARPVGLALGHGRPDCGVGRQRRHATRPPTPRGMPAALACGYRSCQSARVTRGEKRVCRPLSGKRTAPNAPSRKRP